VLLCPPSKQKSPSEFAGQAAIVCSIESGAKLGNALPNRFATGCRHPDTGPNPGGVPTGPEVRLPQVSHLEGDLRRLRAIEFVANESSAAGDPCDRGVA
jgi:hypothetical protein